MPATASLNSPAADRLPALELFGSKWTVSVLEQLHGRVVRFGALRAEIGAVSPKALSGTLKQLEQGGFLVRRAYAVIPPRVEYALTGAGEGLLAALEPVRAYVRQQSAPVVAATPSDTSGPATRTGTALRLVR